MNAVWMAMVLTAAQPVLEPDPGGLKQLQPRNVLSSSYLANGWNQYSENYLPIYVADDNPATAWVEGVDGNGIGETLTWIGPTLKKARSLRIFIRSGYQKSENLFFANARPKEITVQPVILKPGSYELVGTAKKVTLDDAQGWQRIDLPTPPATSGFQVTITSAYDGLKYQDLCISDLRVYVDGDDKYNPATERAAADEVRAFVADRKKAAKEGKGAVVQLAARYKPTALGKLSSKIADGDPLKPIADGRDKLIKIGQALQSQTDTQYDVGHVGAGSLARVAAFSEAHDAGLRHLLRFLSTRELAVYGTDTQTISLDTEDKGDEVSRVVIAGSQKAPTALLFDHLTVEELEGTGDRDSEPEKYESHEGQLVAFEDGLASGMITNFNGSYGTVYLLNWDRSGKTPTLKSVVQIVGDTVTRFDPT